VTVQPRPDGALAEEIGVTEDEPVMPVGVTAMTGSSADDEMKQTNRVGAVELATIKKSATDVDLARTTSATSTPDVGLRQQRFIKSRKPASHTSAARLIGKTDERRATISPEAVELATMNEKCASDVDLALTTSATSTPDVGRRQHQFIKSRKPVGMSSQMPAARLTLHKNALRTRSLRRIPLKQQQAERESYVGSASSLTAVPQSDNGGIETTGEEKERPNDRVEQRPRMKAKSSSTVDLTQMYAASSPTRRRRLSDSERSTKSLASLKHLAGRATQPELFYAISLEHIPFQYRRTDDRDSDYYSATSVEPPRAADRRGWRDVIGGTRRLRLRLSEMTICRLLRDYVFVLFAVSTLITGVGFVVPYVFLPNRGLCLGFDSGQSSWLIAMVGMSNTAGRFVFGFVAGVERVNSVTLYGTMLVVCGVCSIFSVLLTTFPLQMCYALCFGFLSSKSQSSHSRATCID